MDLTFLCLLLCSMALNILKGPFYSVALDK